MCAVQGSGCVGSYYGPTRLYTFIYALIRLHTAIRPYPASHNYFYDRFDWTGTRYRALEISREPTCSTCFTASMHPMRSMCSIVFYCALRAARGRMSKAYFFNQLRVYRHLLPISYVLLLATPHFLLSNLIFSSSYLVVTLLCDLKVVLRSACLL